MNLPQFKKSKTCNLNRPVQNRFLTGSIKRSALFINKNYSKDELTENFFLIWIKFFGLVAPYISSFHVIHESFIDDAIAARSWIVTRKVPVTCIGRTRFVK